MSPADSLSLVLASSITSINQVRTASFPCLNNLPNPYAEYACLYHDLFSLSHSNRGSLLIQISANPEMGGINEDNGHKNGDLR